MKEIVFFTRPGNEVDSIEFACSHNLSFSQFSLENASERVSLFETFYNDLSSPLLRCITTNLPAHFSLA